MVVRIHQKGRKANYETPLSQDQNLDNDLKSDHYTSIEKDLTGANWPRQSAFRRH